MSYESAGPVVMADKSMVTTSLGVNDPEVGTRKVFDDGNHYVFVYNAGNNQALAGYGVSQEVGSGISGYSVTVSSTVGVGQLVGVVRHATLTTGAYGWVVCKGHVPVELEADASCVTGELLVLSTNGTFEGKSISTGYPAATVGQILVSAASGASANAYISVY